MVYTRSVPKCSANLLNLTNSAGTSLSYFDSSGDLFLPTASGYIKPKGFTSAYLRLSDSAGSYLAYGSNSIAMGSSSVVINNPGPLATFAASGMSVVSGGAGYTMTGDGGLGIAKLTGVNDLYIAGTYGMWYQGQVTLTESSATTVLNVPIASGAMTGGTITYTVASGDGTDLQARSGSVRYSGVNKAGTETCTVYGTGPTTQGVAGDTTNPANPTEVQDGSGVGAITAGTLTYAWSVDTSGTNTCAFKLNAVSSLTQTTLRVDLTVHHNGPGTVTVP